MAHGFLLWFYGISLGPPFVRAVAKKFAVMIRK